ncbi:MAG: MotA/TolQ/ExbB proton channel family protein [Elusimicrobia bacterium]|nr:MotA/TolQ/ExbB proton channel family protein [Candidatus Obscuribacterium magneticum]
MLTEMGFMGIIKVNPAIIITLLFFSVLMMTVFIDRLIVFVGIGRWHQAFWEKLKNAVQAGRLHEARTMCQSNNIYARVFHTAINATHLSRTDNDDLVQITKENMQEKLRKRLGFFATFSFISPLVGLLGTVTGIMQAFHDLARSGSGGANIVAAGISEALIATAMGILVAVPAAIFYNVFTYWMRATVVRMNNYGQELIIYLYGGEAGDKSVHSRTSENRGKA